MDEEIKRELLTLLQTKTKEGASDMAMLDALTAYCEDLLKRQRNSHVRTIQASYLVHRDMGNSGVASVLWEVASEIRHFELLVPSSSRP